MLEKTREIELTLSRKTPVVAAPLQHIHHQARCIGKLHEKDLLARYLRDARRIVAKG